MPLQPIAAPNANSDKAARYFSLRVLRGVSFSVLESTFAVSIALARQRLNLIMIDTRMERGVRCEICRAMQSGCSPLKPRFPILHLIFGSGEIVADRDCPQRKCCGSLRWPQVIRLPLKSSSCNGAIQLNTCLAGTPQKP